MSRLTGWWEGRGGAARIELHTRWSFYAVAVIEAVEIGGLTAGADAPGGLRAGLIALVAVHAALCGVLTAHGLDWSLGRRPRPTRLLYAVAALTAACAVTMLPLRAAGLLGRTADAVTLLTGITFLGFAALHLALGSIRATLYWVAGVAAATAVSTGVAGLPEHTVISSALIVSAGGLLAALVAGCSGWLIAAVWELDSARDAQSRLAVAEERLRFGRDLHDVMGRNLAVIALKSELAVQLARHDRPEAVEQMVEVQRIARDSQREVADVVRGYRAADLAVELAGALSVLRAAGVDGHADVAAGSGLAPQVRATFGWVLREATTNVLRHSEATRCTIRLSVRGPDGSEGTAGAAGPAGPAGPAVGSAGSAVLAVENDGVTQRAGTGRAGGVASEGGSGLAGLRERLAASGGTLVTSSRDGVFRLTADVPLALSPVPAQTPPPDARRNGSTVR